jgi:hypothetical protein
MTRSSSKSSTTPKSPRRRPTQTERIYRFETNRHGQASRVAEQILGRCLTYCEVSSGQEFGPFMDRILREESSLLPHNEVRDKAAYERARDIVDAGLTDAQRTAFVQLEDWLCFQGTCEAEAAFLIGLAIGRGGAR